MGTSEGGPDIHLVIWGTDVNIMVTKRQFSQFLRQFIDDIPSVDGGDSPLGGTEAPLYLQRLEEVERFMHVLSKDYFTMV